MDELNNNNNMLPMIEVGEMYYYKTSTVTIVSLIDENETKLLVQDEDGEYYEVFARELY